jgi:hypothetical protein
MNREWDESLALLKECRNQIEKEIVGEQEIITQRL